MREFSVRDVIAAHGGLEATAERCGVKTDAVRKWMTNGCVPPKNWPHLVGAKVTYGKLEALWRASDEGASAA